MLVSSSGGSRPSREPSAVSRWEMARRPDRCARVALADHDGHEEEDDQRRREGDVVPWCLERHELATTESRPQYDRAGGGGGEHPGTRSAGRARGKHLKWHGWHGPFIGRWCRAGASGGRGQRMEGDHDRGCARAAYGGDVSLDPTLNDLPGGGHPPGTRRRPGGVGAGSRTGRASSSAPRPGRWGCTRRTTSSRWSAGGPCWSQGWRRCSSVPAPTIVNFFFGAGHQPPLSRVTGACSDRHLS